MLAPEPRLVWTVHTRAGGVLRSSEAELSSTGDPSQGARGPASRLGLQQGWVVQELGADNDCDDALREDIVPETTAVLQAYIDNTGGN